MDKIWGFVLGALLVIGVSGQAQNVTTPASVVFKKSDPIAGSIALAPEQGNRTFHLRTDETSLIRQVLGAYGIQATIDSSVKSNRVHLDADDIDFADAAKLVELATNTFIVPLDALHAIAATDTKENRDRYERMIEETIYFPGLNASELKDMENIAHVIFGIEHTVVRTNAGTLTVRAPYPQLAALEQTYVELLGGQRELQLDVHIYEIDKTRATNIGVVLPGSTTMFNVPSEINSIVANNSSLINQIISSGLASSGDYAAIVAILIASGALTGTVFNSPFAVFGGGLTETGVGLGGVSANLLLNSSDVRSLDQIELRVLDQEDATIRRGDRYPIMTSSYSSLASKSASASTIPQIQYQDLGLTLKVKPHVEGENEVSLNVTLKLDSLAGTTLNNLPVLNHREYGGVVSLRLGESALVASAMSSQDSLEITGVPGLSDIPGFGEATNRQGRTDSMELAIVITPHLVRQGHRRAAPPMLLAK